MIVLLLVCLWEDELAYYDPFKMQNLNGLKLKYCIVLDHEEIKGKWTVIRWALEED